MTKNSNDQAHASNRAQASFPIVGIGASAGGLEAFTELLKHLPLDTGMGFVLVQHLDPEHESALTQLLARATALPVREVSNNLRVKANCVYVIAPNTNLAIASGILKLEPREKTPTPHHSINFFFESLAQDQRERAIGVILSGAATDGTLGLEAIKAEGGITFAQDDSARHDSMPRSAVAAGCVDFVLSPQNIAHELARIARHPYVAGHAGPATLPEDDRASATAHEDDATPLPSGGRGTPRTGAQQARAEAGRDGGERGAENGYKEILLLLRDHSGVDFSLYKSATIQRRITRRMVLNQQNTLENYAHFLRGNTTELNNLYSDVLISVTSFFRTPEAFDVLKRKVFPKLLQQRGDEPLRVWTLGCSTGQEAYSIAMAFVEAAEKAPRMRKLQVFATDLNEALLGKARHGLYARSLVDDVSPERLRRFFVEEEGGYRISKALRGMVVFARQNLISDPPFSRMDLISCRNLLIYLEPGLQKKALPTFHYALKPEGFLFLGASESIGGFTDLFAPTDKKHKIYSKKAAPNSLHLPVKKERGEQASPGKGPLFPPPQVQAEAPEGFRAELNAEREADRITVNQFAPPGVLINADLQILQFRGATGAYLAQPAGKASFDVLKMAREGLMLPLRAAINKAKKENKAVRKQNVRVVQNGETRTVNLEVIPLKNLQERCFLVLFGDAGEPGPAGHSAPSPQAIEEGGGPKTVRATAKGESRRIAELEADLSETRDYLQSIQEQHESANEELQAANEEVQSANEELQSTNEELETSKEELESSNEELTTVNDEMANRNTELNRLNSDLINLQTSTHLAIVLLARDLTIRRFSTQAGKQFDLLATDEGRPLGNVRHNLVLTAVNSAGIPSAPSMPSPADLESFIAEVIGSVRERECEARDKDGRWYSLRVRPYFTLDNKVDGAVLVLVDIDALKRSEQAILAARDYAEAILRVARDPLIILDSDLRVETANEAFYETFKIVPSEAVGRLIYDLGNRQWNIPKLRNLLEDILPGHSSFNDFEATHDFESVGRRTMLLNAHALTGPGAGERARIVLGIQDMTELLQFQVSARESAEKFRLLFEHSPLPTWTFDLETLRFVDVNGAAVEHYGYSREEFLRMSVMDLSTLDAGAALREALARPPQRLPERETFQHRKKSGAVIDVEIRSSEISVAGKRMSLAIVNDITEKKRAEQALHHSHAQFKALFETAPIGVYMVDAKLRIIEVNPTARPVLGNNKELIGSDFVEVIHGLWPSAVADEILARFRHTLATGEPYVAPEFSAVRDDRQLREYYEWQIHRIPLVDGQYGVVCTFSDIAEPMRLKQDLRNRVEELATADRLKNEFLAMLAHELRNPLAPIRNMLEIMKHADGNVELIEQARSTMQRQLGQMTHLIDDLLDVSRISQGKLNLRREQVELASVIDHAVEACRGAMGNAGHELTVTLPLEPVYLTADATRLAQALENLLSNACKYTDKGGRIGLTLERAGEQAVIRVRDTGIGIAADQLQLIFDMFVQVDTSLERSIGGLGIGLTLVKTLVELHGGTVEVHSAGIGQGSEFVVSLPILVTASLPLPPEPTVTEPAATAAIAARRILVVDDNQDSATSLALLLKLVGNETHIAFDGLAAVEAAATLRPDVVVLDIGLPKLNGYDAARRIREEPWGKDMLLVALTGWGQDEDRKKSLEAGFDAHLVKPVDHVVLMQLLAELRPAGATLPLVAKR